jgi:hypothetical protein
MPYFYLYILIYMLIHIKDSEVCHQSVLFVHTAITVTVRLNKHIY